MKILTFLLAAGVLAVPGLPAAGFFVEAGVSYASFDRGHYDLARFLPQGPGGATVAVPADTAIDRFERHDRWSPQVAAGYAFTPAFGLKLSYRYAGRTTSSLFYDVIVAAGAQPALVETRFSDQAHVVSLTPEWRWSPRPRLTLAVAPELNWVASEARVSTHTDNPAISVVPRQRLSERDYSLGAALGAEWELGRGWMAAGRFQYTDMDPSWGRVGRFISAALRREF